MNTKPFCAFFFYPQKFVNINVNTQTVFYTSFTCSALSSAWQIQLLVDVNTVTKVKKEAVRHTLKIDEIILKGGFKLSKFKGG